MSPLLLPRSRANTTINLARRFHPIHIHLVDMFILQRGNVAGGDGLFAFERNAAKDIVFLGPSQEVWVLAR